MRRSAQTTLYMKGSLCGFIRLAAVTAGVLVAAAARGQETAPARASRNVQQQLWHERYGTVSRPGDDGGRRRFDPWRSCREITVGAGIYAPVTGASGAEACYRIGYMQYGFGGLGFGAGVRYLPELRGLSDCFEVPFTVAWRTPLPQRGAWRSRVPDVLSGTADAVRERRWESACYRRERSGGSIFLSMLLLILPSRVEFTGGVSPGWIGGHSDIYSVSLGGGPWHEEGIVRRQSFTATLDAGVKLSYRIWRFTLSVMPEYHFRVTDNFRSVQESCVSIGRGYFSLTGGLGVMF